jgi:hypothetical protein
VLVEKKLSEQDICLRYITPTLDGHPRGSIGSIRKAPTEQADWVKGQVDSGKQPKIQERLNKPGLSEQDYRDA